MDDHLKDCQIILSISQESTSYHLTSEESTKMEDTTLGSEASIQQAKPREVILSKLY